MKWEADKLMECKDDELVQIVCHAYAYTEFLNLVIL